MTKIVDNTGQLANDYKAVVFYNKSKSNNRGDEGCLYLPEMSKYDKGMDFL